MTTRLRRNGLSGDVVAVVCDDVVDGGDGGGFGETVKMTTRLRRNGLSGERQRRSKYGRRQSWNCKKFWWWWWLWRSVRSCSQTIPEKVRNSIPINMGFKGWGWLPWWSWVIFKPFRYKKFNRRAQTVNFSVLNRLRQELCAENPKNKENMRN